MKYRCWTRALVLVGAICLLAQPLTAQTGEELFGQVVDETGGALPGVQVIATHLDTGTTRETFTDAEGRYSLRGLRLGRYQLTAELMGFALLTQDVTLQIGQRQMVNLTMSLATAEETVTVTGQAPLIDQVNSAISANVDLKQVESLPMPARNWLTMTQVVPGVRDSGGEGGRAIPTVGAMQSNKTKVVVDGHQINDATNLNDTNMEFSQEAIQELKVVTNRMSAEFSRASGGVVAAVTKSGTNDLHGSAYYYVRDDALNADDFFTGEREPFRNTDVGFTIGGPIVENRIHYFGNLEFRRQPRTQTIGTGVPLLDITYNNDVETDLGLLNLDFELSTKHRLNFRYAFTRFQESNQNVDDSLTNGWNFPKESQAYGGKLVSVMSDRILNELHFQYFPTNFRRDLNSTFPGLQFPTARLGTRTNSLYENDETFTSIRNDVSILLGRHDLKLGGEYFFNDLQGFFGTFFHGEFLFNQNPSDWGPVVAAVENSDRAALQRLVEQGIVPRPTRATFVLGDPHFDTPVHVIGGYIQDDWRISDKLTLNLGLRYDVEIGAFLDASEVDTRYTRDYGAPSTDTNNFAPRFGFAYDLTGEGQTVIRGGAGRYFDQINQNIIFAHQVFNGDTYAPVPRAFDPANPQFMIDPLAGLTLQQVADENLAPADIRPMAEDIVVNYTDQYAIGVQHQLGTNFALQADFVHINGQREHMTVEANLFCQGSEPLPVRAFGRPDPRFGRIGLVEARGHSRYEGLQLGLTKRYSQRFQFQAAYTLAWSYGDGSQWHIGGSTDPCDPGSTFGPSERDQRHRFVYNIVYDLPFGVQLGGLFHAASGHRFLTFAGRDLNGDGANNDRAVFADGTKFPRAGGISDPVYRVDLRVSKAFTFADRYRAELIVQMFNLFNRENYDPSRYQGNQSASNFLEPRRSTRLEYQPFQAQIGFRFVF